MNINDILQNLPDWSPRVLLVIVALVIIVILRRVVTYLLERPIRRLATRRNSQIAETIVESLTLPIRLVVIAIGLLITVSIMSPDRDAGNFVNNLSRSIIMLAIAIAFYRLIDIFALSTNRIFDLTGIRINDRLLPLLRNSFKLILAVLVVLIGLQQWGVDVSALIASLGIVGLAFSLAAQDTVSNVFGFGMIISDYPFSVGDYIRTSDVEGIVEQVGLRSTRIRNPSRGLVTVPNGTLASAPIERFIRRRINFVLGVTYETSADEMETLLEQLREMLTGRDSVVKSTVAVYFMGFGDSSLDITIFCDVTHRDWRAYMQEREEINLAVMRIVAGLGLSVAFPTRSLYIERLPEGSVTE